MLCYAHRDVTESNIIHLGVYNKNSVFYECCISYCCFFLAAMTNNMRQAIRGCAHIKSDKRI